MFDLRSITLTNFKSYMGTHEFKFPKIIGLYYFTGLNLSEPSLGANASGKSTFLDAITWCLYGFTTRKLKASDVLPWDSDASCSVTLELTVGKQELQIKRTQKPNSLLLNDKSVDQTELETHIRLNFDSFLYSVINAQFGQSFFSLTPSAKLTLFSDIMGLEFWLEKSEAAYSKAVGLTFQADQLQKSIDKATSYIEVYKKDLTNYINMSNVFDSQKAIKIALKTQELSRLFDKAVSLDEKLADIRHENHSNLKKLERMRDHWLQSLQEGTQERSECIGKIKAFKEQIVELESLQGNCPTCLQLVDKHHLDLKKHELNNRLKVLESLLGAINADNKMFMKYLIQTKGNIDALTDEINEIKTKEMEIKSLDEKIANLESDIDDFSFEINPWSALIVERKNRIEQSKKVIEIDTLSLESCQAELAATQFWIKGFKRVRLFIIEQAFRTLEIEINNSLAQLGMVDWQISFDVERENKSGGITKGFVVLIKSPANTEPVRWESWSGGETQRLQLAGDLGLANLIMHQHGLSNTVEIYDEPSTHLSSEGMLDLANMLYERAISEGKRVWIVDHTTITNFGEFQGIITAKKDQNGSSISLDNQ